MATIEERIQKLEDESAVRNLAARFADAATRGDFEEFESLWTRDAVWKLNEPATVVCNGIAEIMTHIKKLRNSKDFFVEFVPTGVVEVEGNRASARWTIHEVATGPGGVYYNTYGLFSDKMVILDGKWVFSERVYDYMWMDHLPFNGDSFKLPEFNTLR